MINHNKLVRDKIPEIIRNHGDTPEFRTIEDDAEYLTALTDKLVEEAREVQETPILDELADALEVVYAIGKAIGHTPEDIEKARAQKAEERGGFDDKVFLISTS